MKIAIYSRKSKFTGKGESIENQIEMCENYINSHFSDDTHSISVFEDEGFSGKNLNRPQFQTMMSEEHKNPFDLIIVYRLDRISRNVGDFSSLIDELNGYNTAFVSIKEQFDTSTPMGRAMMNIAAVFAQLERETIAERVKDNMYMLARTGRWLGGVTPLGYDSKKVENLDSKDSKRFYFKLEQNEEIKTVKLIFDKYIELRSLNKLMTYLINHDIKSRQDKNFAVVTIRKILTNPIYCIADIDGYNYFESQESNMCCTEEDCTGEFGFIGYAKTQGTAKNDRVSNDMNKWIISVGKHKGMIDGKTFVLVQNILLNNADKNVKFKQSHNPVALLSGLLVCECGSYMRPKYYRVNKQGVKPFAYMCELKEHSKSQKCKCGNLNGLYADKAICDILLNYNVDGNIFNKYLGDIKNNTQKQTYKQQIAKYESDKSTKQKEINDLINLLKSNANQRTLDYVDKAIVALDNDIVQIDKEIDLLKLASSYNDDTRTKLSDVEGAFVFFKENFDILSVENKRNFLRQCISKIMWDGKNLHIFTKGL